MSGDVGEAPILMDGRVHITNRVYWDGTRAPACGVNVVIGNAAPYGYANFNYKPKQTLRLIETFHRTVERHGEKMGLAPTACDARRIAASGRVAVFLGDESGFDHEGDGDVLRALYRLGLRVVLFSTQSCFDAFAESETGGPPVWNGINDRGGELVALMNSLGILIDITHADPQAQIQIIETSAAPVVASHTGLAAVSGAGMSDQTLRALAVKGGMVGIIGASASIAVRYRQWLAANPERPAALATPLTDMVSSLSRATRDHGEFGAWLDGEMASRHAAAFTQWFDDPETEDLMAAPDQWAAHVEHVIETVGPDHVGIGPNLVGGRSCVPENASGCPDLIAPLQRITTADNVRKTPGENWGLRVPDTVSDTATAVLA